MKNQINYSNLSYSYKDQKVINDLEISINLTEILSIIGTPLSGKSSLCKMLLEIDSEKYVLIKIIKNIDIRKKLINFFLKKGINYNDSLKKVEELNNYFKFSNEIYDSIIYYLIIYKKIFIIDELLNKLNQEEVSRIYKYIKKNNLTLINISSLLKTAIKTDRVIILDKGDKVIEGDTNKVLSDVSLLKKLGFEIPFYIELSFKLKLYGLINNICFDKRMLKGELWK